MPESEDIVPSVKPDLPAVEDFLGFEPYAQTLFDIIRDKETQTPLTIGIFGSWGSGKTSLMTMLRERLVNLRRQKRRQERRGESARPHLTVWFNAWLYSGEKSLGRALILRVLSELRRQVGRDPEALQDLDKMEANLHRVGETTSLGELVISGQALVRGSQDGAEFRLPLATGLSLLNEIAEATAEAAGKDADQAAIRTLVQTVEQMRTAFDRQRVEALEIFRQDFQTLVKRFVSPGVLTVFVDDLDRCQPDKAVEVLEAIKLFFDVPGCIFVLGIDRQVIERGIRLKYKDYEQLDPEGPPPISGNKYLEKIVQIPFQLPPIDRAAMEGYVGKMVPRLLELDPRCDNVFTVGMEPNPRRVKRTVNIFLLLWRLSRNLEDLKERIKPVRLAKMVVIQLHHSDLFNLLPRAPHLLIDLERQFRKEQKQRTGQGRRPTAVRPDSVADLLHKGVSSLLEDQDTRSFLRDRGLTKDRLHTLMDQVVTGPLEPFLRNRGLRDLLTLHDENEIEANFADMTPAEVLEYVHLSHSAAEAWATQEGGPLTLEPQLARIPSGKFLMGLPKVGADPSVCLPLEELATLCKSEGLGADREWLLAQTPQHKVDLPAFEIGKYPVTNTEYAAFVSASEGKVQPPSHWDKGEVPPELSSHPAANVTWQDAMAYCNWLSEQTGKKYRLPTEAEWEKAASWDTQRGMKRRYPWGDEWDAARCNNRENGQEETTPVGQYSQAGGDSPFSVSDMAGNVWEWTLSKWGASRDKPSFAYPYDRHDGRELPEGTEYRVLRGGCFLDGAGWCHASARYPYGPFDPANYVGFRVVRVIEKETADGTP